MRSLEHLESIMGFDCMKDRRMHRNQASMTEFVRQFFLQNMQFLSNYSQFFISKYHFEILTIFRYEIEKSLTIST